MSEDGHARLRALSIPLAATVLGFFGVTVLQLALGTSTYHLTADPLAVAELPAQVGFLSNLGVLALAAGSAVSLWTAISVRVRAVQRGQALRPLLLHGGLLTLLLCIDDLFLLHDQVIPHNTPISEELVLGVIAILSVTFVARHARTIRQTNWFSFVVAIVSFGVMLLVDLVEHSVSFPMHHAIEEGSKFAGIVFWSWWLMLSAKQHIECNNEHRAAGGAAT